MSSTAPEPASRSFAGGEPAAPLVVPLPVAPAKLKSHRFGGLFRILRAILIGYLIVVLMLVFLQRKLIYRPIRGPITAEMAGAAGSRLREIELLTDDGLALQGWHVQAADVAASSSNMRPLVLYFQGNSAHRGRRGPLLTLFSDLGCDVLIVDYRGYGQNPGSPTENALMSDARTLWKHATQELGTPPERIILFGESLGGAVATGLTSQLCREGTPPRGLIVQSSFSCLADAGSWHYPWLPVRWILQDKYPSVDCMAHVTCPVMLYHGDRDEIVPYAMGRKLYEAAPHKSDSGVAKRFVTITDAGHNDIMHVAPEQVREAVTAFLKSLSPISALAAPAN